MLNSYNELNTLTVFLLLPYFYLTRLQHVIKLFSHCTTSSFTVYIPVYTVYIVYYQSDAQYKKKLCRPFNCDSYIKNLKL